MSGWRLSAAKVIFPVGRAEPEYHRHEGEEWLYVLSGRLRLTLGEEATALEPGDAAFFDGMLPHAFDALGEESVAVLFVAGPCLAVIARWVEGEIPSGSTPTLRLSPATRMTESHSSGARSGTR